MPDLTWFKPLPVQQEFIVDDSTEVIYGGGVGSGKTISGGFKVLRTALKWPGTSILIGRQTYGALRDTTQKVLIDGDDKPPIIPPELVAQTINKENKYVLHNGTELLFRSLEPHNIEKLLSLNLGGVYVDECTETTEGIWLALLGRLRHPIGPRNAWGTTNPNGHDWVWRNFHPDGPNQVDGRVLYIQPTEANPHLPEDYIASLRRRPKEWQKRFVDCSFDTAAGAIWDGWDRNVHVFESHLIADMPVRWYRGRAMDHGRRNPTAVLWFMVDNDGFVIVSDEHYQEGMLPSQHAPIIRAKDEMLAPGIRLGSIIAPPDCFRQDHDGHTVADEYRDAANLELTLADDNVDAGLLRVAEWMLRDNSLVFPEWHPWAGTLGPDGKGAPRMFVADRCQNLITEIPDYRWADLSPAQEELKDKPEQPRKIRDHACFPAGTLIASERGDVPIQSVCVGDRVWTRNGLRAVEVSALTERDAELYEVRFSDGRVLRGTEDHPVWLWDQRRFCPIRELESGMCAAALTNEALIAKPGTSGVKPSDPYLSDTTFTTATATLSTTRSTTLNASRRRNTQVGILARIEYFLSQHERRQPSGIARTRAESGTANTGRLDGRTGLSRRKSARSAGADTRHRFPLDRASAQTPVNLSTVGARDSTTRFGSARYAEMSSASIVSATLAPVLGPVRVSSVAKLGAASRSDVYGLTVADDHEFFANGVLVSNCDALRYLLMSRPRPFSAPSLQPLDRPRVEPALTHGLMDKQF